MSVHDFKTGHCKNQIRRLKTGQYQIVHENESIQRMNRFICRSTRRKTTISSSWQKYARVDAAYQTLAIMPEKLPKQCSTSPDSKIRATLYETIYFADAAASDCLTELNDKLAKIERYQRRAFSRRNRSLRTMRQHC
jgi:hypothetical protein